MTAIESQPRSRRSGERPADPCDHMEWAFTLSVVAYGVSVGVRLNDSRFVDELLLHVPPDAKTLPFSDAGRIYSVIVEPENRSSGPLGSLYVNGSAIVRRASIHAILRAFESNLQIHVAEMAPEHVFIHAGVVVWKGCGILLPGRSFSGKTTLTTALVEAGAQYYSDEYAVLDADGAVYPYARPPSVRQAGASGEIKHRVHTYGELAGIGPLPVGLVVVTKFRSNAEWRPRRLSPGHGALALLANTVSARRIPETVVATLQRVIAVAPVVRSDRAEASTVVEPILELAAHRQLEEKRERGSVNG